MSGTRQALILGAIPIVVGLIYLVLQVTFAEGAGWVLTDGSFFDDAGAIVAEMFGTIDPAGVVLLLALGISMGFGFMVILRGARDL